MPQMMPMYWTLALLSVILLLSIMMSMMYFTSLPTLNLNIPKSNRKSQLTWTWVW